MREIWGKQELPQVRLEEENERRSEEGGGEAVISWRVTDKKERRSRERRTEAEKERGSEGHRLRFCHWKKRRHKVTKHLSASTEGERILPANSLQE